MSVYDVHACEEEGERERGIRGELQETANSESRQNR